MEEEWRDVEGYEGLYQVSDQGNVRSLDRITSRVKGKKYSTRGKAMVNYVGSHGYVRIGLSSKVKRTDYVAHRLVAQAFIPNPNNLPQINHISGVKTQNNVENLEWVSSQGNIDHAIRTGLRFDVGENNNKAILTEIQVIEIRKRLENNYHGLGSKLAREYKVSPSTICGIKNGREWKHTTLNLSLNSKS